MNDICTENSYRFDMAERVQTNNNMRPLIIDKSQQIDGIFGCGVFGYDERLMTDKRLKDEKQNCFLFKQSTIPYRMSEKWANYRTLISNICVYQLN